jgi:FMN phosphatase YigB (HAD superfamily)
MALDLSRIKAICFDVDGTLSDTDDLWIRVLEERLKPFRHLFPEGNVRPFVRWLVMESDRQATMLIKCLLYAGCNRRPPLPSPHPRRRQGTAHL